MVEPALAHRAEQRLAGDAGMDRQGIAGVVEHGAQAPAGVGAVDVVLHVLLARADELHRPAYRLRGLDRLQHVIGDDLAAEAAAEKRHIELHVVDRAADRLRDRLLAGGDRLDRSPDLDLAVLVARGGIDRLERRMRDVGQHETPLDHRGGALLQDPRGRP